MQSIFSLGLTERQKQIGFCLLSGMSIKEIANHYKVSIHTIREHQKIIKKKLSCRNAYQVGCQLGFLFKKEQEALKIYANTPNFRGDHP